MASAWRKQQSRDRFFRKAKQDGYRARSAYKLLEIVRKFKLIRAGSVVLDLGAAPGSWTQVAVELAGPSGRIVAVDIAEMSPLPGVDVVRCDIAEPECVQQINEALGGKADIVLSDIAPSATGVLLVDQARSITLAGEALAIAQQVLNPGGAFVVKVFRGPDFDYFVAEVRRAFQTVRIVVPEATRKESREVYVVGIRFRP